MSSASRSMSSARRPTLRRLLQLAQEQPDQLPTVPAAPRARGMPPVCLLLRGLAAGVGAAPGAAEERGWGGGGWAAAEQPASGGNQLRRRRRPAAGQAVGQPGAVRSYYGALHIQLSAARRPGSAKAHTSAPRSILWGPCGHPLLLCPVAHLSVCARQQPAQPGGRATSRRRRVDALPALLCALLAVQ